MIFLSQLGKRFGAKELFSGVSLQLNPGERYGLVGANGSGKSTFLKMLIGDELADEGQITFAKELRIGVLRQDQFHAHGESVLVVAMQGDQLVFDALPWYCPAAQGSQCVSDVRAPEPPTRPATHAVHEACPPLPSYLPCGHASHSTLFAADENRPAAHGAQVRSALALGSRVTRVPAAHTVCVRHVLWPSESWNWVPGSHGLHAVAPSASANCPFAQFPHARSELVVGALTSYVPLRQPCALRHTVFPGSGWYCPTAHAAHEVLALAFWIWPAGHVKQYAVAFWSTVPVP